MAASLYRVVKVKFWDDTLIQDEFTPEDKYFYLYLLTNPHVDLSGCFEVPFKKVAVELGYDIDTVKKLINRFKDVYHLIDYDDTTKELLIINWPKNNWTTSSSYITGVSKSIELVKSNKFYNYLSICVEDLIISKKIIHEYDFNSNNNVDRDGHPILEEAIQSVPGEEEDDSTLESICQNGSREGESDKEEHPVLEQPLSDEELYEKEKNSKSIKVHMCWTNRWLQNKSLIDALITWLKLMAANNKFQLLSTYRDKVQLLLNNTANDEEAIAIVNDTIDKGYFSFQYSIDKFQKNKKGYRI